MSKGKKIDRPWEEKPSSTPPIWTSSMSFGTKKTPVNIRVGRGKPTEDNGSEEDRRRAALEEYVRRTSHEQNNGKTYSFKYFGVSEGGKMGVISERRRIPLMPASRTEQLLSTSKRIATNQEWEQLQDEEKVIRREQEAARSNAQRVYQSELVIDLSFADVKNQRKVRPQSAPSWKGKAVNTVSSRNRADSAKTRRPPTRGTVVNFDCEGLGRVGDDGGRTNYRPAIPYKVHVSDDEEDDEGDEDGIGAKASISSNNSKTIQGTPKLIIERPSSSFHRTTESVDLSISSVKVKRPQSAAATVVRKSELQEELKLDDYQKDWLVVSEAESIVTNVNKGVDDGHLLAAISSSVAVLSSDVYSSVRREKEEGMIADEYLKVDDAAVNEGAMVQMKESYDGRELYLVYIEKKRERERLLKKQNDSLNLHSRERHFRIEEKRLPKEAEKLNLAEAVDTKPIHIPWLKNSASMTSVLNHSASLKKLMAEGSSSLRAPVKTVDEWTRDLLKPYSSNGKK